MPKPVKVERNPDGSPNCEGADVMGQQHDYLSDVAPRRDMGNPHPKGSKEGY